jgi:hypothetical protein
MTECPQIEEIDAFRHGELGLERRAILHAHIEACEVCQRELSALQEVDSHIVKAHNAIEPRDEWISAMKAMLAAGGNRIDTTIEDGANRIRNFVVLATAALLLIAASLAMWFFSEGRNGSLISKNTSAPDSETSQQNTPRERDRTDPGGAVKEPTVLAQGDFLVGRHPGSDDEIELYWVLPIQHKQ